MNTNNFNTRMYLESIPKGWIWTTIGEITLITSGNTPKGNQGIYEEGEIPFFKVSDMNKRNNDIYMNESDKYVRLQQINHYGIRIQKKGTIIFPKRGGAISTNKKRILIKDSACDSNIMGLYPIIIPHLFLYYWIRSIDLKSLSHGSNIPQINNKDMENILIPLPPLDEQYRIVEKIEEIFEKLDVGIGLMKKINTQLDMYRFSVLANGFQGNYSRHYYKDSKKRKELIPFSKGYNDSNKKKDTYSENPQWIYSKLEDLVDNPSVDIVSGPFGSDLKSSEYMNDGVPIIMIRNVDNNVFINENLKFVSEDKYLQLIRHNANKGDILITKLGNPLGKACIVPDEIEKAVIVSDVVRVRIDDRYIDKKFLTYVLNSKVVSDQLNSKIKGTTRPRVNLNDIRELVIPVPPREEQLIIISEIEKRIAISNRVGKLVNETLIFGETLRHRVLKDAFEGKLNTQNQCDEPAELLLEQIKMNKLEVINQTKQDRECVEMEKEIKNMSHKDTDLELDLYQILLNYSSSSITPKELWKLSNIVSIEDFYEKLSALIDQGKIIENRPNSEDVLLEVRQ